MVFSLGSSVLAAAGCGGGVKAGGIATGSNLGREKLPGVPWPRPVVRPAINGAPIANGGTSGGAPGNGDVFRGVIARSRWAKGGAVTRRLNRMNGVSRITIHHSGSPYKIEFTDIKSSMNELEDIRKFHVNEKGWGDIGYHYIIDRAGRLYQGRSVAYQGAHVKVANEHNVGVMVLGNFDLQSPSQQQLNTLANVIKGLRAKYKVKINRVYTHQEIKPTGCPGKALQSKVNLMRKARKFI